MTRYLRTVWLIRDVYKRQGIDMIELEIPLIPLWCLFSDREGGVEEGAIDVYKRQTLSWALRLKQPNSTIRHLYIALLVAISMK